LSINRTSLYYTPVPIRDDEIRIKHLIDEIYTVHPEFGYRRMTKILNRDYHIGINQKKTRRYMREMGIHGFCPGPNLSKRLRGKYVYPYLLRGLNIDHPNQVWSIDITYCRMKQGFMYLTAIIDWHSRYIVGFTLSNTLEKAAVIETVKKAIKQHGKPEIINCDRGVQYCSNGYQAILKKNGMICSMSRKGNCYDNACAETFFSTIKCEMLYNKKYITREQARRDIFWYIEIFYNRKRQHQSLDYLTPSDFRQRYYKNQVA